MPTEIAAGVAIFLAPCAAMTFTIMLPVFLLGALWTYRGALARGPIEVVEGLAHGLGAVA